MQAEDDELDDEDWHVRHRDGGHLIAAEKSHHERIEKAERRGDQILHDDRQRQQKKMLVNFFKIGQVSCEEFVMAVSDYHEDLMEVPQAYLELILHLTQDLLWITAI